MVDTRIKQHIDGLSYYEMLKMWRFSPSGSSLFEGESGQYFTSVMLKKESNLQPGEKTQISKSIGW